MRQLFCGSFLLAVLLAIPVQADVITVNFTQADLFGPPGDTLTFGGTLVNTGPPVFINSASLNLASFGPSAYDLSDFILNAPLTALADGELVGPFDFFTVTIPLGFAAGSYDGALIVQGGATLDGDAVLGSGSFTVNVSPEVATVPEPGSLLLLGTLLVGLGTVHRLRQRGK